MKTQTHKVNRVKESVETLNGRKIIYPDYKITIGDFVSYIIKYTSETSQVMWAEIDAVTGEDFNYRDTKREVVSNIIAREWKA